MARGTQLRPHLSTVDPALLAVRTAPRPPPARFAPAQHLKLLPALEAMAVLEGAAEASQAMQKRSKRRGAGLGRDVEAAGRRHSVTRAL